MKEKSGSNIHISKMNSATYLHLDYKISKKKALKYILDKMNVEKHAFYPFITFDKIFYKIYKENKEVVTEIKKGKFVTLHISIDTSISITEVFLMKNIISIFLKMDFRIVLLLIEQI